MNKEQTVEEAADTEIIRILREYFMDDQASCLPPLTDDEVIEEFKDEWSLAMDMAKFGARWQLEQIASLKSRGWISVEDRLPEDIKNVLLLCEREWENDDIVVKGWYKDFWFSQEAHEDEMINVTHWMPLPLPPTTALKTDK